MTIKDLQGKSISELSALLLEQRLKLKDLRFKDANHQLKDIREIREVRQNIARIFTILNAQKGK